MRLWYTFLEPMLGVPCQSCVADNAESKAHDNAKNGATAIEIDAPQPTDAHAVSSKHLKPVVNNGNENVLDVAKSCRTIANGNATSGVLGSVESKTAQNSSDAQPLREPNDVGAVQRAPEGSIVSNAISHAVAEANSGRTNVEVISGTQSSLPGPLNTSRDIQDPMSIIDVMLPKEDATILKLTARGNGSLIEGSEINRNLKEHVGCSKSDKEEGELSPNCDSEENSIVCGDAGVTVPVVKKDGADCSPCQNGNVVDAVLDNDADADDEDSGNASEAGDDASGTESGDECSREEHEEEEDVENDEIEGKAESESEADFQYYRGNRTELSQSERFLICVKPVKKYVSSATEEDVKMSDSHIFYGNDNLYVLFRLHHTLYERMLAAKISSTSAEANWKNSKETSSSDRYASFMSSLYNLLDGSSDKATFEDDCRTIIGNQAYVLFTLDKLIYKLVKQLQTVATDEIDTKLIQLFEYEKSRMPGKFDDSAYHENALVLLHDDNIYRITYSCTPAHLSIQLMDSVKEKPNVIAVSMEAKFSSYLHNDFLSLVPGRKESYGILLYRNRRNYVGLDENSAMSMAMEGVQLFNGLEHKIACSSSKIYYVLDTEDFFHRPSKRRRKLPSDQSTQLNQAQVQRFHKFISSVL